RLQLRHRPCQRAWVHHGLGQSPGPGKAHACTRDVSGGGSANAAVFGERHGGSDVRRREGSPFACMGSFRHPLAKLTAWSFNTLYWLPGTSVREKLPSE